MASFYVPLSVMLVVYVKILRVVSEKKKSMGHSWKHEKRHQERLRIQNTNTIPEDVIIIGNRSHRSSSTTTNNSTVGSSTSSSPLAKSSLLVVSTGNNSSRNIPVDVNHHLHLDVVNPRGLEMSSGEGEEEDSLRDSIMDGENLVCCQKGGNGGGAKENNNLQSRRCSVWQRILKKGEFWGEKEIVKRTRF